MCLWTGNGCTHLPSLLLLGFVLSVSYLLLSVSSKRCQCIAYGVLKRLLHAIITLHSRTYYIASSTILQFSELRRHLLYMFKISVMKS